MSVNSFLNNFVDRVVLVTGGASGIGRAVAVAFAERGCKVVIADVNVPAAEDTILLMHEHGGAPDNNLFVETDVADPRSVRNLFREIDVKYGRLDFAVNCAGVEGERGLVHETSVDDFARVFDTNCKGMYLCMQEEIKLMLRSLENHHQQLDVTLDTQGINILQENLHAAALEFHPSIVNITSTAGLNPTPEFSAYGASKHAQIGLTKTAAMEYAGTIRVNAIAPATTFTPMYNRFAHRWPEWQAETNANYAVGRIATAEEVARAAVWLCSRECNFMIGHVLSIDGGQGFPSSVGAKAKERAKTTNGSKLAPNCSCAVRRSVLSCTATGRRWRVTAFRSSTLGNWLQRKQWVHKGVLSSARGNGMPTNTLCWV